MPTGQEQQEKNRGYWLWVTRPEFYQDEYGRDAYWLDPTGNNDASGSWTCHKNTKRGDLALLWRTSPKRDICHLMYAESDAYEIANAADRKRGWKYECDFRVLSRFRQPLTLGEIKKSPVLKEWGALRANFQGQTFEIPPEIWLVLTELASEGDSRLPDLLRSLENRRVLPDLQRERDIEAHLANNLSLLSRHGYQLEIYRDDTGRNGRQLVCTGLGGRIDLLCYEKKRNKYVVIELKNVRANRNTLGQILPYIGWVQRNIAGTSHVEGLVISRGCDKYFDEGSKTQNGLIRQINVSEIGID